MYSVTSPKSVGEEEWMHESQISVNEELVMRSMRPCSNHSNTVVYKLAFHELSTFTYTSNKGGSCCTQISFCVGTQPVYGF